MSVCVCNWGEEMLGGMITPPRTARKPGYICETCGGEVKPGQRCVDSSFLYADDYAGRFLREHAVCYELKRLWMDRVCGDGGNDKWFGGLGGRECLEEAAQHAVAHGDDPYWRYWLLLYEESWEFWEERIG